MRRVATLLLLLWASIWALGVSGARLGRDAVRSDKAVLELASHVRDLHHGGDAAKAFQHHDKDGDEVLSMVELQRMLGHHKDVKGFFSKSIKATRLTKALDTNADGHVDKREWLASVSDNKKIKNEL